MARKKKEVSHVPVIISVGVALIWVALWLSNYSIFGTGIIGRSVGGVEALNCYENDGGIDYYHQGRTIYSYNDKTNSYEREFLDDKCKDQTKLIEYFCQEKQLLNITYDCPTGCQNGLCNPLASISSCYAQDGLDYTVAGNVQLTFSNGSTITTARELCRGNTVLESYCTSSNSNAFVQPHLCPYGCMNGVCLPAPSEKGERSILLECGDSDGGSVYNESGVINATLVINGNTIGTTFYRDRCVDQDRLTEYHCRYTSSLVEVVSENVSCSTKLGTNGICRMNECVLS